jgi:hypothetical protein
MVTDEVETGADLGYERLRQAEREALEQMRQKRVDRLAQAFRRDIQMRGVGAVLAEMLENPQRLLYIYDNLPTT